MASSKANADLLIYENTITLIGIINEIGMNDKLPLLIFKYWGRRKIRILHGSIYYFFDMALLYT